MKTQRNKQQNLQLGLHKPRASRGRFATEREAALYERERRMGLLEMKIASLEADLLIERRKNNQLVKTNTTLQQLNKINTQ